MSSGENCETWDIEFIVAPPVGEIFQKQFFFYLSCGACERGPSEKCQNRAWRNFWICTIFVWKCILFLILDISYFCFLNLLPKLLNFMQFTNTGAVFTNTLFSFTNNECNPEFSHSNIWSDQLRRAVVEPRIDVQVWGYAHSKRKTILHYILTNIWIFEYILSVQYWPQYIFPEISLLQ